MTGQFIAVGIGGAIGAMARYGVGIVCVRLVGEGYPWGTLAVNLIGGLLMGLAAGLLAGRGAGDQLWLLLAVGVLGGFTTFSAFSLEVVAMLDRGAYLGAAGYVAISVAASVGALVLGRQLL